MVRLLVLLVFDECPPEVHGVLPLALGAAGGAHLGRAARSGRGADVKKSAMWLFNNDVQPPMIRSYKITLDNM